MFSKLKSYIITLLIIFNICYIRGCCCSGDTSNNRRKTTENVDKNLTPTTTSKTTNLDKNLPITTTLGTTSIDKTPTTTSKTTNLDKNLPITTTLGTASIDKTITTTSKTTNLDKNLPITTTLGTTSIDKTTTTTSKTTNPDKNLPTTTTLGTTSIDKTTTTTSKTTNLDKNQEKIKVEIIKDDGNNYTIKIKNKYILTTKVKYIKGIISPNLKKDTNVFEIYKDDFETISNNIDKVEIEIIGLGKKYLIAIVQNNSICKSVEKYYFVICTNGNSRRKEGEDNIVCSGLFSNSNNKVIKYIANGPEVCDLYKLMFCCNELMICDLTKLDFSKIKSLWDMCGKCRSLNYIYLPNFDGENVDMAYMFDGCINIENIDLSNFKVRSEKINEIFQDCVKLECVNMSGFTEGEKIKTRNMIKNCTELKKFIISNNNKKITYELKKNGFKYEENNKEFIRE